MYLDLLDTALGRLFEYPQILKEPTADILAAGYGGAREQIR